MKLILCLKCLDVVALNTKQKRKCLCGNSWGIYTDKRNAKIGGDAVPLGIVNLLNSVKKRKNDESVPITAFVIEKECKTIDDPNKWSLDRFSEHRFAELWMQMELGNTSNENVENSSDDTSI